MAKIANKPSINISLEQPSSKGSSSDLVERKTDQRTAPPNPATVSSTPPTSVSTLTPRIAETFLFPCKGVVSHNDFRFAASQCKMLTKIIFSNLMMKLCDHLKH